MAFQFVEVDFMLTITNGLESLSDSISSGELYAANGNVAPGVGTVFYVQNSYTDFTGGDLVTAKGSSVEQGDTFEITGPSSVSYVVRLKNGTPYNLGVIKSNRLVVPYGGIVTPSGYEANKKLQLPYDVTSIKFSNPGGSGSIGLKLYFCLNDSDSTLIELPETDFSIRTGVNDILLFDGVSETTIDIAGLGITNAVGGKEIIIRGTLQFSSPYEYLSDFYTYYTGDPRRSPNYAEGSWSPPDAANVGSTVDGISRFIVRPDGAFALEDWNDGNYDDYKDILSDPPLEAVDPGEPEAPDVNAAFSATPRSGRAPHTVQFTNESSPTTLSYWHWEFGDGGSNETDLNPDYTYLYPGTYTVSLSVATNTVQDSISKTDYILVDDPDFDPDLVIMKSTKNNGDYWKFYIDKKYHLTLETQEYVWKSIDPILDFKKWTLVEFHTGDETMYVGTRSSTRHQITLTKFINGSPEAPTENKMLVVPNSQMKIDELKIWSREEDLKVYYDGTRGTAGFLDVTT